MKTLKQLKEKVWFRLLKVLYLALYLPLLFFLIGGVLDYRKYHPEILPPSIPDALLDPKFKTLDFERKRELLSQIDMDFAGLQSNEQNKIINMKLTPVDYDPFKKNDTNKEAGIRRGPWEKYQSSTVKGNEYTVNDPSTNKTITFIWKELNPPTEKDLEEVFAEAKRMGPILELERQGKLSEEKKALLTEARRRGLVSINNSLKNNKSMADIAKINRINRNIRKMIDQKAPEKDIDAYIASEDIVWDAPKTYREVTGNIQLDAPPTYNYSSYYTWQIKEALYFALIFSLIYLMAMEAIKRAFYYVVIGKVFPKE